MVQMIIAPLVFSTLVVGIAKMGEMQMVGRVGAKAMAWFISASLISLLLGMVLVNTLAPGKGTNIKMDDTSSASELLEKTQSFSLEEFLKHVIPKSIFEAFATNEILQIVIFSILFGIALSAFSKKEAKPIIKLLDSISHVVLPKWLPILCGWRLLGFSERLRLPWLITDLRSSACMPITCLLSP